MHILAEYISCVVLPTELQTAIDAGYNEIYVMTSGGILKHHKLRGSNRHVRLKVDSIPGYTEQSIQQEINFLPAGRIPVNLFDQIVAFFKQVMAVKKAELEAMAWICHNEELGYHIIIPDQRVSKASASYDWSSLPVGTSIVCDIHSHNTMGAFFSGTDNRDDAGAIGFSGVVGQINNNPPQTVWRFNYRDKKVEAKFENIFEVPVREVPEPQADWLGKVTTPSAVTQSWSHKNGYPTSHQKDKADHLKDYQFKKGQGGTLPQSRFQGEQRLGPAFHGGGLTPASHQQDDEGPGFQGEFWDMGAGHYALINPGEQDERAESAERVLAYLREDPEYYGGTGLGKTVSVSGEDVKGKENLGTQNKLMAFENDRYDEIAINHGTLVAESYCEIDNHMAFLNGKDDLIKELISDMMHFMSEEGQVELFRDIFNSLPSKEQEKIQMNGL